VILNAVLHSSETGEKDGIRPYPRSIRQLFADTKQTYDLSNLLHNDLGISRRVNVLEWIHLTQDRVQRRGLAR
jgi:hypothetical protein